MRIARVATGLTLALLCICFEAASQNQKTTVTGTLVRAMAIGGESTGWSIQLDSELRLGAKPVRYIEVNSQDIAKLKILENKRVKATGSLSHREGVETGTRNILEIASIRELKVKSTAAFTLIGSDWLLEDLAGAGVVDNSQATLAFPEEGKVTGNASCNRFFGPVEINKETIKLGPLGSTRMACPGAVMNQETKYLNALQTAERFEWKDPYLLLHCKGFDKPLRFTRKPAPAPAAKE